MKHEVVFIVNVQDFAYQPSMFKIRYAGSSLSAAYEYLEKAKAQDDGKLRITLDAVEGTFVKRLETIEASLVR